MKNNDINICMSLLMFVINRQFVLVGADTRGTFIKSGKITDTYNKLIKTNNNVIIGCSNISQDCYKIIKDYANIDDTGLHFQQSLLNYNDDYDKVVHRISKRFQFLTPECECLVVVCGIHNGEFEATSFCKSQATYDIPIGISRIQIPDKGHIEFVMGSSYSKDHLKFWINKMRETRPSNIRQFKNTMLDVFDEAVKFDVSVNNQVVFEMIKK